MNRPASHLADRQPLDGIAAMAATSVLIPPLAVRHWLGGLIRHRGATPLGGPWRQTASPAHAQRTAVLRIAPSGSAP